MKNKKGFTLIELSLAIAFISILLITIAILTINVISVYQKGIALKAVNSTGRELISDFTAAVSSSSSTKLPAYEQIFQERKGNVNINGKTVNTQVAGAFCSGNYSYLWNSGYILNKKSTEPATELVYLDESGARRTTSNFRLLKIEDSTRAVCHSQDGKVSISSTYNIQTVDGKENRIADPIELLSSTEDDLAIYNLYVFNPTQNVTTKHTFYSATFILATLRGDVDITATGDYCTNKSAANLSTDFAYCAINKFNFSIRATGERTNKENEYEKNH